MKTVLTIATLAATLIATGAADAAAKKRQPSMERRDRVGVVAEPRQRIYPNAVYSYDGDLLGADPDPFIRLMLIREGKPRDQSGI